MKKIRVHELAKELKKSNREVSDRLRKLDIPAKSNLSSITQEEANEVRKSFGIKPVKVEKEKPKKKKPAKKAAKKPAKKGKKKPAKKAAKKPARKAAKKPARKAAKKPARKAAKKPVEKAEKAEKPAEKKPAGKPVQEAAGAALKRKKAAQAAEQAADRPTGETENKREPVKEKERPPSKTVSRGKKKPLRVAPREKKGPERPLQKDKKVYRFVPRDSRRRQRTKSPPSTVARKLLRVPSGITVKDFSQKVGMTPADVIRKLMGFGEMLSLNQPISDEALKLLSEDIGLEIRIKSTGTEELKEEFEDRPQDLEEKPPVVTVMGHVDHGKTLLLDTIRKTDVVGSEVGGITQHIGAYQIQFDDKPITFIDTPGHESFTAMRARGAQITDIAVLVVAADDGVMPQTLEALDHAQEAGVPIIVAVNKIDKHGADPHKVRQQLSERGLVSEEWGGDTVFVDVSAKEAQNIDHLLEMIVLLSEMNELRANPKARASGVVVEAELDRARGPVATFLVQRGTLEVGDVITAGTAHGKVRAMFDDRGEVVEEAGPSRPVEVLGLSNPPRAGDSFQVVSEEKTARQSADRRRTREKIKEQGPPRHVSLENLFERIKEGDINQLKVVVKADTQGSLEVVLDSLKKLSLPEAKLQVIHSGVGGISETDIMLASASDALVIGFHVRPDSNAAKGAEHEGVEIKTYQVIYRLTDEMESALVGMLEPEYEEEVVGRAEVRDTFRIPGVGIICGVHVQEGEIARNSKVRVVRDGVVVWDGKVSSLKRFKEDAKSVTAGFECGVGLEDFHDFKEGDIFEVYRMVEVPRKP